MKARTLACWGALGAAHLVIIPRALAQPGEPAPTRLVESAHVGSAGPERVDAVSHRDFARVHLALHTLLGTASSPYVDPALPSTAGYGAVLMPFIQARVFKDWLVSARVPWVMMRIEQPAGALYEVGVLGNAELGLHMARALEGSTQLQAGVSLGLPMAQRGASGSQLGARALTLANALEGFAEPELYTLGMLSLTPSAQLGVKTSRWWFSVALKVPLLLRASDADLPPEVERHAWGLSTVLNSNASVSVWRWLRLGAEPRLTLREVLPAEDRAARVQLLLGARSEFIFGPNLSVALGVQAPLLKPLGGAALAGTLRVQATF